MAALGRRLLVTLMVLGAASCGGSNPATPSPPSPPTPPAPAPVASTAGRVANALTETGVPRVAITGASVIATTSDTNGNFNVGVSANVGEPILAFNAAGFVSRTTGLRVPGPPATVSVIPSDFDLRAFDEMFRVSMLLRWSVAPPLKVQTRVLQFTATNNPDFIATAEEMTDAEYTQLVADLQWALPQLTGGRFTAFAGVSRETAETGASVHILNSGAITVARYTGLTQATGFWGYSRWFIAADGTITGGESMLDRDFERSGSPFLRSLRSHELGHSLGCNHVTVRPSVMNSAARLEPNDFDRDAARIAFQRPPGNRSPDVDPGNITANRVHPPAGAGVWAPPIH